MTKQKCRVLEYGSGPVGMRMSTQIRRFNLWLGCTTVHEMYAYANAYNMYVGMQRLRLYP